MNETLDFVLSTNRPIKIACHVDIGISGLDVSCEILNKGSFSDKEREECDIIEEYSRASLIEEVLREAARRFSGDESN